MSVPLRPASKDDPEWLKRIEPLWWRAIGVLTIIAALAAVLKSVMVYPVL